jgi:hypothetical protein
VTPPMPVMVTKLLASVVKGALSLAVTTAAIAAPPWGGLGLVACCRLAPGCLPMVGGVISSRRALRAAGRWVRSARVGCPLRGVPAVWQGLSVPGGEDHTCPRPAPLPIFHLRSGAWGSGAAPPGAQSTAGVGFTPAEGTEAAPVGGGVSAGTAGRGGVEDERVLLLAILGAFEPLPRRHVVCFHGLIGHTRSCRCVACAAVKLVGLFATVKEPVNTAVPRTISRCPKAAATLVAHRLGFSPISVVVHVLR